MTLSVVAPRVRRSSPRVSAAVYAHQVRKRVGIVWALLFFNALTFYPGISFVHIPSIVGKGIAQAALPAAVLVALTLNRKLLFRPNVMLCLMGLLVFGALIDCLAPQHFGTIYRTFRLAAFLGVIWLLTPWWGRRDLLLVRCHLWVLGTLLGMTLVGLCVAPGRALVGGRLGGVLWPIPSTQVAHYAAVTTGLVLVLWFCGRLRSRPTMIIVTATVVILILTHTRTALVGLVAGVLVAGMSLIVAKARVRKLFAAVGVVAGVAILTLSSAITTWLARGEGSNEIFALTGRTSVWSAIVTAPRNHFQEIFGFGLSNSSFDGLPIDSNWLASYQEQGLFGVGICAIMLLFLLVNSYFRPRSVERALALFLVTYCLAASFTEVGFTDVSPYLLELTLAASLIIQPREPGLPEIN